MPPSTLIRSRRARRTITVLAAAVVVVLIVLLGVDVLVGSRTERSLARSLMTVEAIDYEPEVTIRGTPFLTHAADGSFNSATIQTRGVPIPDSAGNWVEMAADLGPFTVPDGFAIGPGDEIRTESVKVFSRIDSVNLGRVLGITDLMINTPAPEGIPGAGGPADGLQRRTSGFLLTGTVPLPGSPEEQDGLPPSASEYDHPTVRITVTVDVAVVDRRIRITATDFYSGPELHESADIDDADRQAVLDRFSATLPELPMPWNIAPTGAHSAGSDLMMVGSAGPSTLRPADY